MPRQLTSIERELYEKGLNAKVLLDDKAFAAAINDLSNDFGNQMLSTQVHERQKREDLFLLHTALHRLVVHLNEQAAMAEKLQQAAEQEDDDQYDTGEIE